MRNLVAAAVTVFVLVAGPAAFAGPSRSGDLDPGFGEGGRVVTDFGNTEQVYGVATARDGSILVAGRAGDDFMVAKYGRKGGLDTAFGSGGRVTVPFGGYGSRAEAVAIQADGKIVAVGHARTAVGWTLFAAVRLQSDGSMDASFSGGSVTFGFGGNAATAQDVLLRDTGEVLLVGTATTRLPAGTNVVPDWALAQLTVDGTLDGSFGIDGMVTTDFAGVDEGDEAFGAALQSDGRLVVAGGVFSPGAGLTYGVARYLADGSLDGSFGVGGKVATDVGGLAAAYDVAVQDDGRIVAVGTASGHAGGANDFGVARYTSDGTLDTTFGGDGVVTTDMGGQDAAFAVELQPVSKTEAALVVVGEAHGGTASVADFGVVRYTSSGALDGNFGTSGRAFVDFGSSAVARDAILASGHRLVVAGFADNTTNDAALARIYANPTR